MSLFYRQWVFTTEEEIQVKFTIFYTKCCVHQQDKDFIDKKISFEKRKISCFLHKTYFHSGIHK